MPRLTPFVYAPMKLKGELIKQYPNDLTEIPKFDLVLGGKEDKDEFADWTVTRFGEIRKGEVTCGGGRFLYKLHDVTVVQGGPRGPFMWYIVMEPGVCAMECSPKSNRYIPGSEGITIDFEEWGRVAINLMPTYEVSLHEKEPHVFHAHTWENNYFHRVVDSLPRGWAETEGLAPEGTPYAHRDQIAVKYDTLYFPSFWPSIGYSPEPVHWLRERLKKNPARDGRGVLYLSRADATKRRVVNETEVCRLIQDQGFSITCATMNGLTLQQQVELAERAEVIIGPHGAALTNAIFGSEATVIEFVPEKFLHPVYGYLSKWAGHRYMRIICHGDRHDDLTVDLDALVRCLSS